MNLELNKIHHNDNRLGMIQLPEKCANLIIADPPYYRVKGEFDFEFASFEEYQEFMRQQAIAYKRILADNGTLFVYGSAKRIAYVQVIFDQYFNLVNNIAIEFNRQTKKGVENFRCFAPVSERLLMYSNEIEMSDLEILSDCSIKPQNPFKDIIKEARLKAKLSTIQVAEAGKFYGKVNHGGSVANWENGDNIPNPEQWVKLSEIIPLGDYDKIKERYDELRNEYEIKRRPFDNFLGLFDVMKFDQETHITKNYDHDTVKPETLTRALILTCSRKNDLVVVPFAGSGTECAMAKKEGRNFIGFEKKAEYVEMSNNRVKCVYPQLF